MAMQVGDEQASSGMAKDIYDQMDQIMKPTDPIPPASLEEMRKGWKKLAFAVASGVITHIKNNMEISGIQGKGDVTTTVTGTVAGNTVTGSGTGSVTTDQTVATTGHVS
jgi:hypothetical protein